VILESETEQSSKDPPPDRRGPWHRPGSPLQSWVVHSSPAPIAPHRGPPAIVATVEQALITQCPYLESADPSFYPGPRRATRPRIRRAAIRSACLAGPGLRLRSIASSRFQVASGLYRDFGEGTLDRGNNEFVPSCCLYSGMRGHRTGEIANDHRRLSAAYGRGFSVRNRWSMRQFFLACPQVGGRQDSADSVCRISPPPGCVRFGPRFTSRSCTRRASSRRRQLVRHTYKLAARWSAACATATSMRSSRLGSASAATGARSSGRATVHLSEYLAKCFTIERAVGPRDRLAGDALALRVGVAPIARSAQPQSKRDPDAAAPRCASRARRTHVATSPALW
jgi:hypothetical protein